MCSVILLRGREVFRRAKLSSYGSVDASSATCQNLFRIASLLVTLANSRGATADFDLAPILKEQGQQVIVQANFPSDGKPVLKARLFGTAKDSKAFNLHFTTDAPDLKLDGEKVFDPKGKDFKKGVTPSGMAADGVNFNWSWEGIFESPAGGALVSLTLGDGSGALATNLRLGDVWVVAGGDNVSRVSDDVSARGAKPMQAFQFKPAPAPSSVAAPTPGTGPANAQNGRPFGVAFGQAMANTVNRPVEVYVVHQTHATFADWLPKSDVWKSFRATPELPFVGARGFLLWSGEWDAERKEEAGKQVDTITKVLHGFAGQDAAMDGTPTDQSRKQTLVLVQLPGVTTRVPPDLSLFDNASRPSSWETERGAQAEAVSLIQGEAPSATWPHAVLIPAMGPKNLQDGAAAQWPTRWFWDVANLQDFGSTIGTYVGAALALDDSVRMALPQPPAIQWTTKGVILNFPAGFKYPTGLPAVHYYCLEDKLWHNFTNPWTEKMELNEPGKTVVRVRYGEDGDSGDNPPQRAFFLDQSGKPLALIPPFDSTRP